MNESISEELTHLLYGTGLILIGSIFGMGAGFATRVVAARYLTQDGYGQIILGLTILNIASVLLLFGLPEGLARQLPRSDHKSEIFQSSIVLNLSVGIMVTIISLLGANYFRSNLSNLLGDGFYDVLFPFIVSIPLLIVIRITIGGFRGLGNSKARVIIRNITNQGAILLCVILGSMYGVDEFGIASSWLIGMGAGVVVAALLLKWHSPLFSTSIIATKDFSPGRTLKLVKFSIPLMFAGAGWMLLNQTDNFLLGVLSNPESVAVYDTGFSLSQLFLIFPTAFGYLALPLFSKYDSEGSMSEFRLSYKIISKWMVLMGFPIYIFILFNPKLVLKLTFGERYIVASPVLRLVSTGIFIHLIGGLNAKSLTAIGRTKLVLIGIAITVVGNAILNILLIPEFGPTGAAIASVISYTILNIYYNYKLYSLTGAHSIHEKIYTPIFVSILTLGMFMYIIDTLLYIPSSNLVFFALFLLFYPGVIFRLGLSESDKALLLESLDRNT